MGETCSKCGCDINDNTIVCPNCGHRVLEERLKKRLEIVEPCLYKWRSLYEEARRFACDNCDGGPCDGCPCEITVPVYDQEEE